MGNDFSQRCCPADQNQTEEFEYQIKQKKLSFVKSSKFQQQDDQQELFDLPSKLTQVSKFYRPSKQKISEYKSSQTIESQKDRSIELKNAERNKIFRTIKQLRKAKLSQIREEYINPEQQYYDSNFMQESNTKNKTFTGQSELSKRQSQISFFNSKVRLTLDSKYSVFSNN